MNNENTMPMAFDFKNSGKQVSVISVENKPWFVANDICGILGLSHVRNAMSRLDDDEKLNVKILRSGQRRLMWAVNESGMYGLIFTSNKPEAKVFRKWVTNEVLPAIRQQGRYSAKKQKPLQLTDYRDVRHIPYQTTEVGDKKVRYIHLDDTDWYSIADINNLIGARTRTSQSAAKLNANKKLAQKLFIFGNTSPSWFTTKTGVDLLISGSRYLKGNTIEFPKK